MIYERDILAAIVAFVPTGDLLPTALTCKALCEVCVVYKKGKWMTLAAENKTRLIWAINVMGLNPETRLCSRAIIKGRLDILIWTRELGYNVNYYKDIYGCAAAHGHIHILEWARYECKFEWDARVGNGSDRAKVACVFAVNTGNIVGLDWLCRNGCPWNKQHCLDYASRKGHTDMVNWIIDYGQWITVDMS